MITGILDTEKHMIEFLDMPTQLLLALVSKSHREIISQFPHLRKYIDANVSIIPKSLMNNIDFLRSNKIFSISMKAFYNHAYVTNDYDFFIYCIKHKRNNGSLIVSNDIHPQLLYKLIQNHITDSQPIIPFTDSPIGEQLIRGRLFCQENHDKHFDPDNCANCKYIFNHITSVLTFDILELIEQLFHDQFTKLSAFLTVLRNKNLEVIAYIFKKYKEHYENLTNTDAIDVINNLHFVNPIIIGILNGIIPKNVSPDIMEVCNWITNLPSFSFYSVSGYGIKHVVKDHSNKLEDFIIGNHMYNSNKMLTCAIEVCNMPAIEYLYKNRAKYNILDLTVTSDNEGLIDYYCNITSRLNNVSHQYESKCIDVLNWLYDNGHPLDCKNSKYVLNALAYLHPNVALWFLSKGVEMCTANDSLRKLFSNMLCHEPFYYSMLCKERYYYNLNRVIDIICEKSSNEHVDDLNIFMPKSSLQSIIEINYIINKIREKGIMCTRINHPEIPQIHFH